MAVTALADRRPATAAQHEVWLAAQREPESGRYNIPVDLELEGRVHVEALREALGDLVQRHPALRSSFEVEDGELKQVVWPTADVPLLDEPVDEPYDRTGALKWAAETSSRPFDLASPPPFRAATRRHPDGALLVLTLHHIVGDGWSTDVLADHFVAAYRARLEATTPSLPTPAVEDEPPDEEEIARYWADLLAREPAQLAPLPDLVRPESAPGPPALVEAPLPPETVAALRRLTEQEQVSPAIAALAVWMLLLHAWSGEVDAVLGMPFHGRPEGAVEEIGQWTRVLPVRSAYAGERPFAEFLHGVAGQVLDSLEHSVLPPAQRAPQPAGDSGAAFRTVYAHLALRPDVSTVPGGSVRVVEHPVPSAKYDLAATLVEDREGMRLRIDYDSAVYRRETATLLLDQLGRLLAAAADAPSSTCHALVARLASPAEGTAARPARDVAASVPELVLRAAAARPEAPAIVSNGETTSYGELVARAARLANWLAPRVARGDVVALLLPQSPDTIVAMLAISLAGAAYLPLEPAYPAAQLDLIVSDARPALVLTSDTDPERLRHPATVPLAAALAEAAELPAEPPRREIRPELVFNVLYTSGSTGRPKGVVLPHAGITRLFHTPGFLRLDESDVICQLSPLNFDGATYEIWGALAHGGTLLLVPKEIVLDATELRTVARRHGVTTLVVTTPLLNRIIEDAPDLLQTVRRVYFGGELISVPHVQKALQWSRPGALVHSYGPTENSFTSTWYPVEHVDERARTVPAGRPVPGTQAYVVLPGSFDLAPPGVPGELLLGGRGVAFGYLADPARTAERFVPSPFGPPRARLYRTGDWVRWTPERQLEFIGRTDTQVKIRSQRVELGEVEAALRSHPDVVSSFVLARTNPRSEKELVAYVVLEAAEALAGLKAHLRATLPPFAVPAHVLAMPELPLTPNGKIDRSRLPAPEETAPVETTAPTRPVRVAAPATPLEQIRAAWEDVLERPAPSLDENFFDAGGHSLLLIKLQAALGRRTGTTPTIAQLLRHTTVRAQTALLDASPEQAATASPAPASRSGAIAVTGLACRFAGAPTVADYWRNLRAGTDCVTTGEPLVVELADGVRRIARWGSLPDVEFDGGFFGLTPEEARSLDPQHGIFYEALWEAVEDGGRRLSEIAPRTSLYAGRASTARRGDSAAPPWSLRADDVVGTDATFMPTLFSYWHDLGGEAVLVDTACSTSLVAVHLACESLRGGSCDFALAGGVSIDDTLEDGAYVYVPGHLYARDGVCRPFDRRASGTVGGDGVGVVLLRRLEDAFRDGDPIYAVLAGTAVGNDGRARVGYSAPGVEGQARVIRQALAAAGLTGEAVQYVEAHGTGTRLGDTIEATALTETLGWDGPPVAVGSVKASIGHTNTAAGVAGLIKAVLAVHHGYLPATPNVETPLEELGRGGDRFSLLPEGRAWTDGGRRRVAGVSSFGVGGTNAHVVVQELEPSAAGAAT